MKDLVYLIGEPGSGKSTALAALTAPHLSLPSRKPFAHIVYPGPGWDVIELGARRDSFSGTDALSMSVQPVVLDWLRLTSHRAVIGEGDRLANAKFFTAVQEAGWHLTVVYLRVTPEVAAARRAARAAALGVPEQGGAWLKGRVTKVARLAEWATTHIDADAPPDAVAAALAAVDAPPTRLLASPS